MTFIYNILKKSVLFFALKYHKVNYYNTDNIPKNNSCLICCNHRSNWDPIFISHPINTKLYFMAKYELFKNPIFGSILKFLGAFPVKRGKKDINSISHAIDLINNKKFVVIFPEGTRSKNNQFLKPKSGAAMIAQKTNTDILPIRIIYHEPIRFRSKVDIIYGNTINLTQLPTTQNNSTNYIKLASEFIMDNIKNLHINN